MLHQPFGSAGGATDTYRLNTFKPNGVYLCWSLDEVGVGIDALTLVEEHPAVTALATTDKEDEVVAGGKLRDVGHAVGHRAANGVEALEGGARGDVRLDIVDDAVKLVERLGGLRVEINVAGEVEVFHFVEVLNDNGVASRLPHQAQYLGVSFLAEDDNLGDSS